MFYQDSHAKEKSMEIIILKKNEKFRTIFELFIKR